MRRWGDRHGGALRRCESGVSIIVHRETKLESRDADGAVVRGAASRVCLCEIFQIS